MSDEEKFLFNLSAEKRNLLKSTQELPEYNFTWTTIMSRGIIIDKVGNRRRSHIDVESAIMSEDPEDICRRQIGTRPTKLQECWREKFKIMRRTEKVWFEFSLHRNPCQQNTLDINEDWIDERHRYFRHRPDYLYVNTEIFQYNIQWKQWWQFNKSRDSNDNRFRENLGALRIVNVATWTLSEYKT